MTLENLKYNIINNKPVDTFMIFVNEDNSFLSSQYVREIAKSRKLRLTYVDEINSLLPSKNDIFGCISTIDSNALYVYNVDKFELTDPDIKDVTNLIIVTNKIDKTGIFKDYIVEMPKLELWQIKDYVYSLAEGVDTKKLDWLISICKQDIFRLEHECKKLSLFNIKERNNLFDLFVSEDMFSDLSDYMIFDLTNALLKKDVRTISYILEDIKNIDVEPVGLVTILYNNFRELISVQLDRYATAEKLGMKPGKFYAISKNKGYFSKEQLVYLFDRIAAVDFQLKSGTLPADKIIDYLILSVLGA